MSNKYYLWFTALVSVIYLALSFLYASNQIVTNEQWFLYLNALDAAKNGNYQIVGQIIPGIGPTVGSIGNFLTSLPLFYSSSPWAPMIFIIVLRFMSFILFLLGLRHFFCNKTLCCFATMFMLSPWVLYETTLTQTSYVIFGVSIVFLSIVTLRSGRSEDKTAHLFKNPKATRFIASIFLIIGLGFCLQLSYLSITLVILVLFLFLRRAIKASIPGLCVGFVMIGLTMLAFINSIFTSDEIKVMFNDVQLASTQSSQNFLESATKGVIGWLRLGATGYSHQIIKYFDSTIISNYPTSEILNFVFLGIVYIVAAFTMLLNTYATYLGIKIVWHKIFSWQPLKDDQDFLYILSIFAFLALVVSAMCLPLRFQVINVSTIIVFALIPMLILIEKWNKTPLHIIATCLVLIISFSIIVNLVAATSSKRFNQEVSLEQQLLERFNYDEQLEQK